MRAAFAAGAAAPSRPSGLTVTMFRVKPRGAFARWRAKAGMRRLGDQLARDVATGFLTDARILEEHRAWRVEYTIALPCTAVPTIRTAESVR